MSPVRARSPALFVNLAESATCGNPPTGGAARNAKFSAVLHRAPAFGSVRQAQNPRLSQALWLRPGHRHTHRRRHQAPARRLARRVRLARQPRALPPPHRRVAGGRATPPRPGRRGHRARLVRASRSGGRTPDRRDGDRRLLAVGAAVRPAQRVGHAPGGAADAPAIPRQRGGRGLRPQEAAGAPRGDDRRRRHLRPAAPSASRPPSWPSGTRPPRSRTRSTPSGATARWRRSCGRWDERLGDARCLTGFTGARIPSKYLKVCA